MTTFNKANALRLVPFRPSTLAPTRSSTAAIIAATISAVGISMIIIVVVVAVVVAVAVVMVIVLKVQVLFWKKAVVFIPRLEEASFRSISRHTNILLNYYER